MKQITADLIASRIFIIRHTRVMIDRDLAALYEVETRVLKQAVRRNFDRFPEDFMFVMTRDEFEDWRSQYVMSNSDKMGLRHAPMVFTEQENAGYNVIRVTNYYVKNDLNILLERIRQFM